MKKTPLTSPLLQLPVGMMILLPLLLLTAGCNGRFPFEDTNPDPHPPRLLNFTYSPGSIQTGEFVSGSFTYTDSGADVELIEMKDTNGGSLNLRPVLPETGEEETVTEIFFFPGTTGTIEWEMTLSSNQVGPHRLKTWLEDSKGSVSNLVYFDVEISYPGVVPTP